MTGPLVIVGDSMLDIDIEGCATRLSPEAPVPVVDADRVWQRPGGAGLAAVLAARAESDVVLISAIGEDTHGRTLAGLLERAGVRLMPLPLVGSTICKTRIRARGQSMLRLDQGDGTAAAEETLPDVADILDAARAICVADYGNGVTAHPALRSLLTRAASRVPLVWDPHPRGAVPVADVALVTPNESEAQQFCGHPTKASSAELLVARWQARAVCVTLGSRGALLATRWDGTRYLPVPAGLSPTGDSCGAGDRFAVAAAAAFGSGADTLHAAAGAVEAAARFLAAGGAVAASTAAPLPGAVMHTPSGEDSMIGTDIGVIARRLRRRGGRVVATGGCFDLLHTGHVRLLRQARDLGDSLVVLLNSDSSVAALKGPGRPVMEAADRARVLAALGCVDAVCVFDELSPEAVLDRLRPDVWVKGGDYRADCLPEADVVIRYGGEVVILPTVPGYSSSNLIRTARNFTEQEGIS